MNTAYAERNIKGQAAYWGDKYDWPAGGDEWSERWGGTQMMWHGFILPRICRFVPTGHILEIAPGFGRCTQYLRGLCDKLTIVDLTPRCIEACRERFAGDTHITYAVNDGWTLPMVADASVDFVFSWDSLVHVEDETMRSYVSELARTLTPGGYGLIHYSNLGQFADVLTPEELKTPPGNRRPSMSGEKFIAYCREFGLRCLAQELMPLSGNRRFGDALSLVTRVGADGPWEATVVERPDFGAEFENVRRISGMYRGVVE